MKKIYNLSHSSLLLAICLVFAGKADAQGVGINNTGAAADTSAMLDVSSTTKGTLITRMTTAQRNAIALPAEGLMIYNTTTKCFEFYLGGRWQSSSCGCTSAPGSAGTISGTAAVCPGQGAVLYSVPAITGATSYTWAYTGTGATIVGSTNAAIIYFSSGATSGSLTVMGTNACGNGTVSSGFAITVNSTAPNITVQPVSAVTCLNTGAVNYTVTATGAQSYQWQEFITSWNNIANAGVYSGATSGTLTITNPPLGMSNNKYRCVVSGTCTSTTSADTATLTVNPVPSVTNSNSATICSGTSPNITLTASVASNFAWTIGTITGGITGASAGSGTTINQTLTNPNTTAGSVAYVVTPTSTGGSCAGAAYTITVTVNPTPTVTNSPLTQSICSGANTTAVTLASGVSGAAFAWTATPTTGITGYTASGASSIPVQTISNSSSSTAGTVTYAITATASSCTETANYVITVNPVPVAPTSATVDSNNFCSNAGGNIHLSAVGGAGTTLSWYIVSCGGTSAGTGTPLSLTKPTTTTTYYARWETANCGNSLCASIAITVSPYSSGNTTYVYTGGTQTFTVPSTCVRSITVDATGGQGGTGASGTGTGGIGGRVITTLSVTSGQVLDVNVGGAGGTNGGGWNGGGAGGSGGGCYNGGGGGGASDVQVSPYGTGNRVVVGGGGGGGGTGCPGTGSPHGGAGGSPNGSTGGGGLGSCSNSSAAGGTGGTQIGVGIGGSDGTGCGGACSGDGGYGGNGSGANGGAGNSGGYGKGGGGGGGYFGGGGAGSEGCGGGDGSGGGGGSSYAGTGTSGTTYPAATASGNGVVTISW